jgi:hypothetical protein
MNAREAFLDAAEHARFKEAEQFEDNQPDDSAISKAVAATGDAVSKIRAAHSVACHNNPVAEVMLLELVGDAHKLQARLLRLLDAMGIQPPLELAARIAATTLETVYRERDPSNIAAKVAAERLRKILP